MESKNMIGGIVSLAVVVICVAAIMMPVLSDATQTHGTFDNRADALWQVDKLTADSDYTLEWDYTNPTQATVDGETVDLAKGTVVCATDTVLIRYGHDSTGYYFQSVPGLIEWSDFNLIVYSAGSGAGNLTITASAGTLTASTTQSTPKTYSVSFTEGYGIVADGEYVMKSPTQAAYVLEDSPVYAMGITTINNAWANVFQISGTAESVEVENLYPEDEYTISDVSINKTAVDKYIDLYTLESITFVATDSEDSTVTQDCTFNYFIVPAEVTAELTQHLSSAENVILNAIPAIVIVTLVIGALSIFVTSRRD